MCSTHRIYNMMTFQNSCGLFLFEHIINKCIVSVCNFNTRTFFVLIPWTVHPWSLDNQPFYLHFSYWYAILRWTKRSLSDTRINKHCTILISLQLIWELMHRVLVDLGERRQPYQLGHWSILIDRHMKLIWN